MRAGRGQILLLGDRDGREETPHGELPRSMQDAAYRTPIEERIRLRWVQGWGDSAMTYSCPAYSCHKTESDAVAFVREYVGRHKLSSEPRRHRLYRPAGELRRHRLYRPAGEPIRIYVLVNTPLGRIIDGNVPHLEVIVDGR